MTEAMARPWWILHTASGRELAARNRITEELGCEVYLPMRRVWKKCAARTVIRTGVKREAVLRPAFAGYLFVRGGDPRCIEQAGKAALLRIAEALVVVPQALIDRLRRTQELGAWDQSDEIAAALARLVGSTIRLPAGHAMAGFEAIVTGAITADGRPQVTYEAPPLLGGKPVRGALSVEELAA
ncbi:MAG: transcription termination/antitermination protein NusG [Bosea sp. (in: a-proteobacteria)]